MIAIVELVKDLEMKVFSPGAKVIEQGERCGVMLALIEGRLKFCVTMCWSPKLRQVLQVTANHYDVESRSIGSESIKLLQSVVKIRDEQQPHG